MTVYREACVRSDEIVRGCQNLSVMAQIANPGENRNVGVVTHQQIAEILAQPIPPRGWRADGQETADDLLRSLQERGPAWDAARLMREQSGWPGHAAFMDALADEGFVILGGSLGLPGDDRTFLLIMDADSEEAIQARLDADLWTPTRMLHIARIEPWHILLGNVPAA